MSSSSSSSSSSNAPKVTPAGKKRNRDPLSDQMHERRYAEVSQTKDYWLGSVAVPVTNEKIVAAHKHAMLAVSYQRQCDENFDENVVRRVNIDFDVSLEAAHYDGYLKDRRNAIKYVFFAVHGGPPEAEGGALLGGGTHLSSHHCGLFRFPKCARENQRGRGLCGAGMQPAPRPSAHVAQRGPGTQAEGDPASA